jgi:hypothetical protein
VGCREPNELVTQQQAIAKLEKLRCSKGDGNKANNLADHWQTKRQRAADWLPLTY